MFVARDEEIRRIREMICEREPQVGVVYGRRRVGKTELIRQAIAKEKVRAFYFDGLENQPTSEQITAFLLQLSEQLGKDVTGEPARTWQEAFLVLHRAIGKKPAVIVLDELQWLANYRRELVSGLKMVWDNYLSRARGRSLILCGSIASFMVSKVVRSSAFYGRTDVVIHLRPFRIGETAQLLRRRGNSELLDAQSISGGVPKYIELLSRSPSVQLAVEQEAFRPGGYLVEEYDRIFVSHFGRNPEFERLVRALADAPYGLFRTELAKRAKVDLGGGLSNHLYDLEAAGFLDSHRPLDKPANSRLLRYVLSDAYIGFYYAFIRPHLKRINVRQPGDKASLFPAIRQKATWRSWMGRSFELVCRQHAAKIAGLLGFSGIEYDFGPWFRAPGRKQSGVQIDLAFDRADQVITLCEMKRQAAPVRRSIIQEVEQKAIVLENVCPGKTVQKVLIVDAPVSRELENAGYFYKILTADELITVAG